jgi:two-component system, chemotaxis family, response regulator Rcp1
VTGAAEDAHGRLIRVLLVEDSPEDVLLTRESLKEAKVANELLVVDDGESALDFVHRRGDYEDAARPDVIILDLNLPRKDGREVLLELKEDPELKEIPVVVLTTSTSDEDVMSSYKHHANAFVRKPVNLDRFLEITAVIDDFWLGIVTLPPR